MSTELANTETETPTSDLIRGLWPSTKNPAYSVFLSDELSAIVEDDAEGMAWEQISAMLEGLRGREEKFPGVNAIRANLKRVRESEQSPRSSSKGEQIRLQIADTLKGGDPVIQIAGGDDPIPAHTTYWLERAARILLFRLFTVPAPRDDDPDRAVGPLPSMDDVHVLHWQAHPEPRPAQGDPNFAKSHSRNFDGTNRSTRLLSAAVNVSALYGHDRIVSARNGKPVFAGVWWNKHRLAGNPHDVRFYKAGDVELKPRKGNIDFRKIVQGSQERRPA